MIDKNKLIEALIRGGYSLIDAKNAASGPRAEELAKEYLSVNPIDEFFRIWNNQPADYDHKYGPQCVDLIRYFLRHLKLDAYALPAVNYAKDFLNAYNNSPSAQRQFEWIPNSPKNFPLKGDIVVWKAWAWKPFRFITREGGHVAIAGDGCNVNHATVFNQNWPTGSVCHFIDFDYTGVMGWFRLKK